MDGNGLVVGVVAVFAGTTTLLAVLAVAYQPFLLPFAALFGLAALWYHASGRLADRVDRTAGQGRKTSAGGCDGADPGRGRNGSGVDDGRRTTPRRDPAPPTTAEAYRTLGLDPDADAESVKAAYRERVKSTHPDTDAGDEEAFKRVNRAYERLTEE